MRVLNTFSSFSVNDVPAAKRFYGETLGLDVKNGAMGFLEIDVPGGGHVTCYPKPDHQPATFTVLNLIVPNIDEAVDELNGKGVTHGAVRLWRDQDGCAWRDARRGAAHRLVQGSFRQRHIDHRDDGGLHRLGLSAAWPPSHPALIIRGTGCDWEGRCGSSLSRMRPRWPGCCDAA